MIYLSDFHFPTQRKEEEYLRSRRQEQDYKYELTFYDTFYPFWVLSACHFSQMDFSEITILYGGNGSGKSTALNVIAGKLGLVRNSFFNHTVFFDDYLSLCYFHENTNWSGEKFDFKSNMHIITSDDIFKVMLDNRMRNEHLEHRRQATMTVQRNVRNQRWEDIQEGALGAHYRDVTRHLDFETGENVDEYRMLCAMKKKSASKFTKELLGESAPLYSNGETGLLYFSEHILPDKLYLLDEPENSLSCELQLQLRELLMLSARRCGCQFIIATHSPFLLSMEGAKIYNLDADPVSVQPWYELEQMKTTYSFFEQHKDEFSS